MNLVLSWLYKKSKTYHVNFFVKLEKENNRSVINMRTQCLQQTQYLHDTYAAEWQVCIYSRQPHEKNMQWRPPYNKESGQYRP